MPAAFSIGTQGLVCKPCFLCAQPWDPWVSLSFPPLLQPLPGTCRLLAAWPPGNPTQPHCTGSSDPDRSPTGSCGVLIEGWEESPTTGPGSVIIPRACHPGALVTRQILPLPQTLAPVSPVLQSWGMSSFPACLPSQTSPGACGFKGVLRCLGHMRLERDSGFTAGQ